MAKIDFYTIDDNEKAAVFTEIATKKGMKPFAYPLFQVPTVNPERTFLEKLFLLHEEFHRPAEKIRVNRLSRHIYDIYQLTQSGIASKQYLIRVYMRV